MQSKGKPRNGLFVCSCVAYHAKRKVRWAGPPQRRLRLRDARGRFL